MIVGSVIILTSIAPVVLLIIASSGVGFVMGFYFKGWRLPILVITAVFFIALSLFLLYQIITVPGTLA
jgi:hypothetical protein